MGVGLREALSAHEKGRAGKASEQAWGEGAGQDGTDGQRVVATTAC